MEKEWDGDEKAELWCLGGEVGDQGDLMLGETGNKK